MPKVAALFIACLLELAAAVPVRAAEEPDHPAITKMRVLAETEAKRGDKQAAAFLEVLGGSKGIEDTVRGAVWLLALVKRGVVEAEFTMAVLFEMSKPPNYTKALELHQAAARKGYAPSMTRLAGMYNEGQGMEKDGAKALDWATRAANLGDADAQGWLGARYFEGKIVPKDLIVARDWLEKASRQGHTTATLLLLGVYQRTGVPGDEEKAAELLRRLTGAPSPPREKESDDPATRVQRQLAAARNGDVRAQSTVGWRYLTGEGVEKDVKQAHVWLSKAAEKGDASAMVNLGTLYASGNGVARDNNRAAELYKAAAAKGNAQAQANLGGYFRRGEGGLQRDETEAVRLFKLAAEQGNRSGQRQLAGMYEEGGGGLPKDRQKALEWYRKAAAQGDTLAAARAKALER